MRNIATTIVVRLVNIILGLIVIPEIVQKSYL